MSSDSRPNILLLMTDQQRCDSIACTNPGQTDLRTPNFDRLCAEGLRFDRAYTPNPICVPARYCMLTGLSSRYHRHTNIDGRPLPLGIPCLPQILSNAGYHTHAIGKMHFQPKREHHGFHRMELMEETPDFIDEDDYLRYLRSVGCKVVQQHGVRHLLYHQPQRSLVPEEHHGSRWVADRSIEFLKRNANENRPFFLKASWIAPHPPHNVPARLANMYVGARLPERIARVDPRAENVDLLPNARRFGTLGDGMLENDPPRYRRHKEHYYAAVSFVDEQIGRILATLDELGLAKNTLVLATSDHGEMLGDLDLFQKGSPYQNSTHIPFILRWPGVIKAGVDREHFVDLNDVLPTFLDAARAKYSGPFELPGSSLLDLSKGRNRDEQYIECDSGPVRWCALRTKQFMFVYSYYGGWEALFDLEADPKEQHNLLVDGVPGKYGEVHKSMRRRLVEYEERWGPENMTCWSDFLKMAPFKLRSIAMNNNYPPTWFENLTASQRDGLNNPLDEIIAAVKDEPTVALSKLSLDHWSSLCNIPKEFVERIRKEGL
jgi:arylsulfatase A-like enzyme